MVMSYKYSMTCNRDLEIPLQFQYVLREGLYHIDQERYQRQSDFGV